MESGFEERTMALDLGPSKYGVVREWGLTLDGDKCDAVIRYGKREIVVDGDVPFDAVEALIRHEVTHALEYHWSQPRNDEERAEFSASAAIVFDKAWAAAGGLARFVNLPVTGLRCIPGGSKIDPEILRPSGIQAALMDYRYCVDCEAAIAAGSIEAGPVRDLGVGGWARGRRFACEHCGKRHAWLERCDRDGVPLGGTIMNLRWDFSQPDQSGPASTQG